MASDSKTDGVILGIAAGGFLSFLITFAILHEDKNWRQEAGERGYIEYCLPDGKLAWKGECKK